jgi:GH25 family lysozyme M1 (1,4-beta-N-acetylmuramidase)
MKALSFFPAWIALSASLLIALISPENAAAQRPVGIDVSSYQGSSDTIPTNIVWTQVKTAGISFAWAKATEGTGYIDPDFVYNATHAKSAGVLIGAYHFAHPEEHLGTAGADTEAAYFWNQVKSYVTSGGFYLMPMLDYETSPGSNYNAASSSAWVNEWCNDIVNYGKSNGVTLKPVVYTYTSFATTWLTSAVTNWPLWMASPNGEPAQSGGPSSTSPWTSWTIWQLGASNVSGVEGAVDYDAMYGTSNNLAMLVIGGPSIITQPASITVAPGSNVTFSVAASGTAYYQWLFNGTNLPSATNMQYSITNAQLANAGGYSVLVTNLSGGLFSSIAYLSVQAPLTNAPGALVGPPNLANWWTGDGNALDIEGTANGSPQGNLSYTNGKVGLAFRFDGSTSAITNTAASLAVPWTTCLWVYRQNTPQTSAGIFEDGTYSLKLEQYPTTHEVGLSILSVGDYVFSPAYTVPANTWTHLAFVGTSTGTSLYVNGVLKSSLTNSIPLPRKNIGAGYISSSFKFVDFLMGSLDEIMVFSRALSSTEISNIYAAGSAGLIRAPAITGFAVTNGDFHLNLEGLTGKSYTVQSSTDLVTWKNVSTITNPNGTNQFTDNGATNSQLFYRVYQP